MEFEGTHNVIGLRGIERNAADLVMKDGGMEEAVGLIPRDGSLIPYAPTLTGSSYGGATGIKFIRVHHTQNTYNTIEVYENRYIVRNSAGSSIKTVDGVHVKDIVFIGNRMDMQFDDHIEHWLWKDGMYNNIGNLNGHELSLPYVEFNVRRGIFDGSRTFEGVRFVRVIDDYTPADTKQEDKSEAIKEAYSSKYLSGDAMAVLDSVRALGGITGYILVAAAWRRKGSTPSNPQYIMASPIMLMGAPEIYMKDGKFLLDDDSSYMNPPSESYLIDMFDYGNEEIGYTAAGGQTFYVYKKNGQLSNDTDQEKAFDKLWEMPDTDERDVSDLADDECVEVEKLDTNDPCVIRTMNLDWLDDQEPDPTTRDAYSHKTDYSTSGTEAHGDKQVILRTKHKYAIKNPALYQQKYAMYNHGSDNGVNDENAKHRCVTVTHASGNILSIRVNGQVAENYKDEIDRLCVFVSPIINPYKGTGEASVSMDSTYDGQPEKYTAFHIFNKVTAAGYKMHKACVAGSFLPEMKSPEEIRKSIKDIVGMYKIKEYQLSEVGAMSGWVDVPLNGKLGSEKMVQRTDTMLKISDMQPVSIVNGSIFGYNERLHVYDFQKSEVFRLPYKSAQYYSNEGDFGSGQYYDGGSSGEEFFKYEYIVTIVDSNNSTIVYNFWSNKPKLNPIATHGDIEAKSITISKRYTEQSGLLTKYYGGTIDYPIVEIAGISSGFIANDLRPFDIPCSEITEEEYNLLLPNESISQDGMSYGKNEIRVSNPATTLFEPESSHKIGHGEIIGMARLAMGLSQDNYGKYPLVIFCTDGIYTLDVDQTGQTAYRFQNTLGRQVCSNKNGICEIDGAVVFPTEQGLFMVTSDGVQPVAIAARGKAEGYPSAGTGQDVIRNATNNEMLVELEDAFSEEDFLEYINSESCYIKYVSQLSVLICYHPSKEYTYMISIADWSVWKTGRAFLTDNGDYPKAAFFSQIGQGMYKYVFNYESSDINIPCLLETRPIKLETVHQKASYRVVLRGEFYNTEPYDETDPDTEKYYAGLYVFGSYDGDQWYLLGGKEKRMNQNRFNDLGVETYRNSFRLMKVVFVGRLSKDSHIDGLEITNEVRYNDKLK